MKIKYLNTAKRSVKAMDHRNRERVERALGLLPEGDIIPMYYEGTYRLRVGKYRIIFCLRQKQWGCNCSPCCITRRYL